MPELARVLQAEHDVTADASPLSKLLCAAGFTYKKKALLAEEQERADVKEARADWKHYRQPAMQAKPGRLVFLDAEADQQSRCDCPPKAVKMNMCRLRGRSLCGTRLKAAAPFGKWGTQTFSAGLRCGELTAPWIIEGAMSRAAFDTYIEHVLPPTLSPGNVFRGQSRCDCLSASLLDNLSVHHSQNAADALARRGAWFLYLPKYSPDLNPIKMAFSKLKAHLRAAAARTFEDLTNAIGDICALFTPNECWNFFKAANYVAE
jgi:hypothetical protein